MSSPDIADLEAFVAVATARSFRGAAKLRSVSASSLSEAVRRLEAQLDLRLLNRTTRSVTPTTAGQDLLDRLRPALAGVEEALQAVRGADRTGGTLRLNVPSVVSDLILPPLIVRFLALYPDIRIEVVADNNFVDVLAAGFDAGIRYGERVERDMIAIPIGPRVQRYVTAAAPDYLARHGRPVNPQDVLDHACVRFRFSSGVTPAWEFSRNGESVKVTPDGPLVSNRIELLLAAAEAGLGLIHGFEGFIAPSVKAGKLELILEDWSDQFQGPFLYYASRRNMPGPLRAFIDFLKSEQAPVL